jgi:hypothetical protein
MIQQWGDAPRQFDFHTGRVAPRLIPSWLAMVCVVAFSSSLDVAAVEMELGSPLNYDSELQTAVWKSKFHGAYAIDATPARWRGDAGSSPLDGAITRLTG